MLLNTDSSFAVFLHNRHNLGGVREVRIVVSINNFIMFNVALANHGSYFNCDLHPGSA